MTKGERIRQARKDARMTQEELGRKLGVSGSMIAQYETGKRNPKEETMKRIATVLGVELRERTGEDIPTDGIRVRVSPDRLEETEFLSFVEKYEAGTLTEEEEKQFSALLKKRVHHTEELRERIEKLEKTLTEISKMLGRMDTAKEES